MTQIIKKLTPGLNPEELASMKEKKAADAEAFKQKLNAAKQAKIKADKEKSGL
jgi:hypothetical protein